MEKLEGALRWVKRRLRPGYADIYEEYWPLWRQSLKTAKAIDSRYNLSELLDLAKGAERTFFVDCCLAREAARIEVMKIMEKQEQEDENLVRVGKGKLAKRRRELMPQPAKPLNIQITDVAFFITGEWLFEMGEYAYLYEERLCQREKDFKAAKRELLGTIISTSRQLYPVAIGDPKGGEKQKAVNNICEAERRNILLKRRDIFIFLKDPGFYREVFPGIRAHEFTNGVVVPPHFLMVD